jgi:hypothetical protein
MSIPFFVPIIRPTHHSTGTAYSRPLIQSLDIPHSQRLIMDKTQLITIAISALAGAVALPIDKTTRMVKAVTAKIKIVSRKIFFSSLFVISSFP